MFQDYAETAARAALVVGIGLVLAKFLMVQLHGLLNHLAWVMTR